MDRAAKSLMDSKRISRHGLNDAKLQPDFSEVNILYPRTKGRGFYDVSDKMHLLGFRPKNPDLLGVYPPSLSIEY